ncbi:hypothetical protein NC653_019084 [Populus alba x Populus x berolinensis]|uniref:F-box/LRR-repeat protein 15-like leucin rich repeat domain-containing protein n=1 Tax=Populus alba x Populus x berolinensis TaxID=444605 RepID=A0AAD6QHY5_9ROSI|nr:hypothetical protein NC653_019084 [Populus alba x Populus x berolinensis]
MRPPDGGFQGCVRIVTTVPPSLGELRPILSKLENDKDKEIFGLVSKRWLRLQSTERKELAARAGPHMLQKMAARCLKVLNLQHCKGISDKGLLILHLDGCKFVTDKVLKALSKNCPNLQELGLQGCTSGTDCGLAVLVSGCRWIHFLDINKCSNLGDSGISNVSEACSSSLKTLKLLDCFRVGNESILSLARFCKNLESFIIGGCRDICDKSIKSLATSCCVLADCHTLEHLDVRSCPYITKSGCDEAGLQFPDYCKVNYTGSLNEPDVLL